MQGNEVLVQSAGVRASPDPRPPYSKCSYGPGLLEARSTPELLNSIHKITLGLVDFIEEIVGLLFLFRVVLF